MRAGALALAVVALVLAVRVTLTSTEWVGRVFPGFMLLDNRVVASVGLAHWSGATVPGLYQTEVTAVENTPVSSTREIYEHIARLRPGTPVRYRLRHGASERDVTIATQRFGSRDWTLLFGAFLLNGTAYLASGLVVWVLQPRAPVGRALLASGITWAFFLFTAMDLYGPASFFRLHVVCETFVPPALLQLTFLFPQPHRWARWRFLGYVPSLAVVGLYQNFLYVPAGYSTILYANMTYLGIVGLFMGWRLISEYWRGSSPLARQRVRIVTVGALCGFSVPAAIVLASLVVGGGVGMNLGAFSQFLFSLSLAYAVVKHDLFEIDAMVKRGAYYLALTGAVAGSYVVAVSVFNVMLKAGTVTGSPAFPVLFALAVLFLLNPIRTRLQGLVDRLFFRTSYDAARELAALGRTLPSAFQREQIARLVCDTVDRVIPNGGTRLLVTTDAGTLEEAGETAIGPRGLARRLAEGRVVTAFDPVEAYDDGETHEAVRSELSALKAEIAVPLRFRSHLVGVLVAGAKRTGLFYTAGDAQFLRALGHQVAVALENARSYEALVDLNTRLEQRVRERAGQLEAANRDLASAYAGLKSAEGQLVHAEKMASLGRLVAGVAHEINNPVSFIATSVAPLRRRLAKASALAPPGAQAALREAEDITAVMERGAERTTAIVKDLRAFSRLGEGTRKQIDLHEGLDVTLRLLEPRWRDRIAVHQEYGALPRVECDPGQLNQVFMNVLANACDAIPGRGNLWITTHADDGESVAVTIRDDGPGIPPDVLGHIFDPFFTTKDVGSGTGLGLAISQTVVSAHGGRIDVESPPSGGAIFRIILPVHAPAAKPAAAAV